MPLSREDILNYEELPRQVQLPSGVTVTLSSLGYLLVLEMLAVDKNKEDKEVALSKKVIKVLLRENGKQEFYAFTREDQEELNKIAAKERGCKEEFENFPDTLRTEDRFYKAVFKRSNRFRAEMIERMKQMTSIIPEVELPRFDWFEDYQKSLNNITAPLTSLMFNQMSEAMSEAMCRINQETFDQFSKLGQHALEISKLGELILSVNSTITIPYEESLLASIEGGLANYRTVMDNIVAFNQFRVLPEVERYYPSIEMRNLSIAANVTLARDELVVIDEVITPEDDELTTWLGGLDSTFPDMLRGAEQTISSRNPDRCRHFASSHRELCTNILQALAPDDEVSEWTDDPNHFYEGRPTRKARLLFIGRNRNNQPFVDFLVSSFLVQMKLLNADEHKRQHDYGERELRILHESFLSTLGLIMQIVIGE